MHYLSRFSLLVVALTLVGVPAFAQTPDGETPANEGVCDDLMFGSTPGLYGLCVGFCEAQDCEATVDPTTGEVTFDESCRPSSPKLLANYNRRKQAVDPAMPCVNIDAAECPCWTAQELANVGDGQTEVCDPTVGLSGIDFITQRVDFAGFIIFGTDASCFYIENTPRDIIRSFQLTTGQKEICSQSIASECTNRGF